MPGDVPRWRLAGEAGLGLALSLFLLYFVTFPWTEQEDFVRLWIALGACALAIDMSRRAPHRTAWRVVAGLAAGLWVFNAFRYAGFVRWPLARPDDVREYLFLLVHHVTLAAMILAGVLWLRRADSEAHLARISHKAAANRDNLLAQGDMKSRSEYDPVFITQLQAACIQHPTALHPRPCEISGLVRFGHWTRGRWLLAAGVAAMWAWAVYYVASTPPRAAGSVPLLIGIALAKACLTGVGEEALYRGLILPAATARYGAVLGIILQAALYAGFHMHLEPVLFGRAGFLAVVFALGIVFGLATRLTRGIGWACLMHVGLNVWIEWSNLS